MAHNCPTCGMQCHCGGDIDDLNFGDSYDCTCCDEFDDGEFDDWDDEQEEINSKK